MSEKEIKIPTKADDFVGEMRTTVVRDVTMEVKEGYEGKPDYDALCFHKDVIDQETGEVVYTSEWPDSYAIRFNKDGQMQRNSMWGKMVTDFFPRVLIRETGSLGLDFDDPEDLKGLVFIEEKIVIEFGKKIDPKEYWVPVEVIGKYEDLYDE